MRHYTTVEVKPGYRGMIDFAIIGRSAGEKPEVIRMVYILSNKGSLSCNDCDQMLARYDGLNQDGLDVVSRDPEWNNPDKIDILLERLRKELLQTPDKNSGQK